jgi:hypothetical protein
MTGHSLARGSVITCSRAALLALAAFAVVVEPSVVVAVVPLVGLSVIIFLGITEPGSPSAPTTRTPLAVAVASAVELYVRGLSLVGLIILTGRAAVSILTVLILCAGARWWARGQLVNGWLRVGDHPTSAPLTPLCPLHSASTAQLCRRWRATYLRFQRDSSPIVLERIASLRGELLAEFERRDPAGFARFLRSGDPAGCYPARHCRRSTGQPSGGPFAPDRLAGRDRHQLGAERPWPRRRPDRRPTEL